MSKTPHLTTEKEIVNILRKAPDKRVLVADFDDNYELSYTILHCHDGIDNLSSANDELTAFVDKNLAKRLTDRTDEWYYGNDNDAPIITSNYCSVWQLNTGQKPPDNPTLSLHETNQNKHLILQLINSTTNDLLTGTSPSPENEKTLIKLIHDTAKLLEVESFDLNNASFVQKQIKYLDQIGYPLKYAPRTPGHRDRDHDEPEKN